MKYLLFLSGFFCVTGNYCHNLSFSGGIYGNKHIIYRRKNLKTFDLICISCLAGVISAGDVWRGRPAHSGKICFIRRCIRGFDRFSDHDYINKSDQQFRNGNHNFAGTADRKRKKEEGGRTVGTAIVMFAAIAVVMSIIMVVFAPSISQIMNAPEEAFQKTVDYIRICGGGMLVIVAYNLIGCLLP